MLKEYMAHALPAGMLGHYTLYAMCAVGLG